MESDAHVDVGLVHQHSSEADQPQSKRSQHEQKEQQDEAMGEAIADVSDTRRTFASSSSIALDILSLLLATASLVGLIAMLHVYDGKPSPDWSVRGYGVTLNAIISILGTTFEASLMMPVADNISQFCWIWYTQPRPLRDVCYYDEASRGSLGSLRLLFRVRFKQFVSVAALVTLAAVALGPFFQQIVKYDFEPAITPNERAQSVAAYTWGSDPFVFTEAETSFVDIPYNMKSAIYSGLLSSGLLSIPSPPVNCSTGNCTWDPFATLAISTHCVDIASEVQLNCTASDYCNFVAPKDPAIQTLLVNTTKFSAMRIQSGRYMTSSSMTGSYAQILKPYANVTGYLAVTEWVKATGNLSPDLYLVPNTTFEALRCVFYVSVQQIQASVSNGVYSEQVLQEYTYSETPGSATPTFQVNGTSFYFLNSWGNSSLLYKPSFAHGAPNLNDTFSLPLLSFNMLYSQLSQDILNGNIDRSNSAGLNGPEIPTLLYQADNTTRAITNLAQYMTISMRANDSLILQQEQRDSSLIASEQAVQGAVWTQQQIVTVRWAWLALPVMLLVLAFLLLLIAFLGTHSSGVGAWRSSPLTLFFHGRMSDEAKDFIRKQGYLNTSKAMETAADGLCARIAPGSSKIIEVHSASDTTGAE